MQLFGPPNIKKLKEKRNFNGLIKALRYKKDSNVRNAAAKELGECWWLTHSSEFASRGKVHQALIDALKDGEIQSDIAFRALFCLRWNPSGEVGAAYYISNRDFRKCITIGAPAVGPLTDALKKDSYVTRDAAFALGEIGDRRAVEPLINALSATNSDLRASAAMALVKIGDKRAVEPLIKALKEKTMDNGRSLGAAYALGELRDERAVGPLLAALNDYSLRVDASSALEKIGTPAVEPLIAALKDERDNVREYAISVLGNIGDRRAVEPLIDILEDKKDKVRETAAKALMNIGLPSDRIQENVICWLTMGDWKKCVTIGPPAVDSLIKILKNGNSKTRRFAALALADIGDKRAVEPLITTLESANLLSQPGHEFASELRKLGDHRAKKALDNYEKLFGNQNLSSLIDRLPNIRTEIVDALDGGGDFAGVTREYNNSDYNSAITAIKNLGSLHDPRAIPSLIAYCKKYPDWRLIKLVLEAIGDMGDPSGINFILDYWRNQPEAEEALCKIARKHGLSADTAQQLYILKQKSFGYSEKSAVDRVLAKFQKH